MLYLSGKKVPGQPLLLTPQTNYRLEPGVPWAADNGCFTDSYPGDDRFLEWLHRKSAHRSDCLFVACPDVVANSAATLLRWKQMAPRIRRLGWPIALVLQDGMTIDDVLGCEPDAIFIGGTTRYKLGADVRAIVAALPTNIHVHMGRVNSLKRMRYAHLIGCGSADGTLLAFNPQAPVFQWAADVTAQLVL